MALKAETTALVEREWAFAGALLTQVDRRQFEALDRFFYPSTARTVEQELELLDAYRDPLVTFDPIKQELPPSCGRRFEFIATVERDCNQFEPFLASPALPLHAINCSRPPTRSSQTQP